MVQDRFYEGFQVVRVGLGADEGAIQSHIDLFEERVDQVVGQSHDIRGQQVGIVVFLDCQFHFKVTFFQIDEIFLRVYLEGDGIDPDIERVDPDKTSRGHTEIRRRHLEHVQVRVPNPRRAGMSVSCPSSSSSASLPLVPGVVSQDVLSRHTLQPPIAGKV